MSSIDDNSNAAGQRINFENEDLTFGVKLECIGFMPINSGQSATHLASTILQQKVLLECKNECEAGSHEWFLPVRGGVAADKSTSTSTFSAWEVQRDTSIRLNDMEQEMFDPTTCSNGASSNDPHSSFEDIELVSRVSNFDSPTTCPRGQIYPCTKEPFEWKWRDEICAILQALKQAFSKPGHRILVNGSAGLHVHLGHGSQGFGLDTVKGITGDFIALEHCFDSAMPVNRIVGHMDSKLLYGMDLGDLPTGTVIAQGFSHSNLQAMSDAMCGHVNNLIDAQFQESKPAGWDPENVVRDRSNPAPENVDIKTSQTYIETSAWGADSGWGKVETPDWLGSESELAAEGTWLDTPQDNWEDKWDGSTPTCATDPAKASKNIRKLLLSHNIPAWLQMVKSMETLEEIKALGDPHRTSINLKNLHEPQPGVTKNTIEVRVHAGSLDAVEITSWIDLLGSLTHHIERTASQRWFQYLNTIWAQSRYTLVNLCHRIGAAEGTTDHYTGVLLTPDYAERRHTQYTTGPSNPHDRLHTLTHCIESNRLALSCRPSTTTRITQKLESGLYGQFPLS